MRKGDGSRILSNFLACNCFMNGSTRKSCCLSSFFSSFSIHPSIDQKGWDGTNGRREQMKERRESK